MTAVIASLIAPARASANLMVAIVMLSRHLPIIGCGLVVAAVAVDLYLATRTPELPDMVTFAFRV